MKELYIECNMGVAGDMLSAALLDTLSDNDRKTITDRLNSLLPDVSVTLSKVKKNKISASKLDVSITECGHHHTDIAEIYGIINGFDLPDNVKENAKKVYSLIANAESKVHGTQVADVHLHEVGAKDAIIDVTAFCYILDYINIEKVHCSSIVTGYGSIKTQHGILSVPAPATAELLKGMQIISGDIEGELTTPTGAAIVKYFAGESSPINMNIEKTGYGAGTKDFAKPNVVRVFIGESDSTEDIYELRCQLDDMTGEEMGYAITKLIDLGAKDAYVKPIVMKKSRPAFEFTVITTPEKKDELTAQIFKHTTTLGVRQVECKRCTLSREITENNCVHIKKSAGYGTEKSKIEFDDLARIADEKDISLFEARRLTE